MRLKRCVGCQWHLVWEPEAADGSLPLMPLSAIAPFVASF